jgi:hypothetical protein
MTVSTTDISVLHSREVEHMFIAQQVWGIMCMSSRTMGAHVKCKACQQIPVKAEHCF